MNSDKVKRLPAFIGGIFAVITGLCFVFFPETITEFIAVLFGVVLVVAGLSEIIGYVITIQGFREENYGKAAGAEIVLVYSIIIMVIGAILILKHDYFIQLLPTILGLFFIIDGIVKVRKELFIFRKKDIHSWVMLLLAIFIIVAGLLLIIDPFKGTKNVIVFSGCAFIVSGIESCFLGVIRRIEKITRKD